MNNRIHDAFQKIKAEEQLKQNTFVFLQKKIRQKYILSFKRFTIMFASVAVVLIMVLMSHNIYFTETAFLDIDVNPSIELTLNPYNRVIGVYPYNDDGKKLLSNVNINNKTYDDALKILIDKMIDMGYVNDTELFTATLQVKDGSNKKDLLDSLKAYIDSALRSDNISLEQEVFMVDSYTKEHAHEQNLTPAKYLAILELQAVDPTVTFDGCRNHHISEIRQETHGHSQGQNDNSEQSEDKQEPMKNNSRRHGGHHGGHE